MRKIFSILRLLPLIVLGVGAIVWGSIIRKDNTNGDPFGFNETSADVPDSSSSSSSSSSGD